MTCQGYSFLLALDPPTILVPTPPFCPHWQLPTTGAAVVGAAVGEGEGGAMQPRPRETRQSSEVTRTVSDSAPLKCVNM